MKVLYRYVDPCTDDDRELGLQIYAVMKETPCGWWIYMVGTGDGLWYGNMDEALAKAERFKKFWGWRSKSGHFAFTDKADALQSYIRRKDRHLDIIGRRYDIAKHGRDLAYTMKSGIPAKVQPILNSGPTLKQLLDRKSLTNLISGGSAI